jgi:DNA replication and repair protein RecF
MHIDHLSLQNFRNYARLELSLPHQPLVIYGDNAQGKTSLLEALAYLATARSPYTTTDRQLIHWRMETETLPYARLAADMTTNGAYNRLEITLMLENNGEIAPKFKKVIKLNGVDKRVMDIIGLVTVVLFLPQDLALIEGSPNERRRFMNDTLAQIDRDYYSALENYDKLLPQRNALLKRIADKKAKVGELAYWDEQIALFGATLIAGRQQFLRELEYLAQRAHADLTGHKEMLTLVYQPSFMPTADTNGQQAFDLLGLDLHRQLSPDDIVPQFTQQLHREQRDSIDRGMTLSGPHRDELRLFINGRDVGLYGSRGQARTAILALKLAQLEWMKARTGDYPLLLLDEVVAELDSKRRAYLLSRINDQCQTLLTTTELDTFSSEFLSRAQILHVENGQIASK